MLVLAHGQDAERDRQILPREHAFTPGSAAARDVSIETMRAWGGDCGAAWRRASGQEQVVGEARDAHDFRGRVHLAVALPTTRKPVAFLPDAIQGLGAGFAFSRACGRRQLDGLVDLDVTGAAAEVAGERLLDLVARGTRARSEERLGGEEERRRAVAALCRASSANASWSGWSVPRSAMPSTVLTWRRRRRDRAPGRTGPACRRRVRCRCRIRPARSRASCP